MNDDAHPLAPATDDEITYLRLLGCECYPDSEMVEQPDGTLVFDTYHDDGCPLLIEHEAASN